MSLNPFFKWVFNNKEFEAIISWYSQHKDSNPLVWKEFLQRVTPLSNPNSFEFKSELYFNRRTYSKLLSVYSESEEIKLKYPMAVNTWRRANSKDENNLSFCDREKLIKEKEIIRQVDHFFELQQKYPIELNLYLKEKTVYDITSIIDICSIESVLSISELERIKEIKDESDALIKHYTDEFTIWKQIYNITSSENTLYWRKLLVYNKDSLEVIREYCRIQKSYNLGLEAFLQDNGKTGTLKMSTVKFVISNKKEVKEIDEKYRILRDKYKHISIEGISELSTLRIYEESDLLIKNYPKEFLMWKRIMNIPSDHISFSLRQSLLLDIQVITRYLTIRNVYEQGLMNFISENQQYANNTISSIKSIVENEQDIIKRDLVFKKIESYREYTQAIVLFLKIEDISNLTYNQAIRVVDNISKIKTKFTRVKSWINKVLLLAPDMIKQEFLKRMDVQSLDGLPLSTQFCLFDNKQIFKDLTTKYNRYIKFKELYDNPILPISYFPKIGLDWDRIEYLLYHEKEISNAYRIYNNYNNQYSLGLASFLKDNPEIDVNDFQGVLKLESYDNEIITRDKVIRDNTFLFSSKYAYAIKYFLRENIDIKSLSYSVLFKLSNHIDEIKDLESSFRILKDLYYNAKEITSSYLSQLKDVELSRIFPKEPILQIREEFLNDGCEYLSKIINTASYYCYNIECYSQDFVRLISGEQHLFEINDISKDAIRQRQDIVNYFIDAEQNNYGDCTYGLRLTCDVSDRDTEIRIILNSDNYPNNYHFDDDVPISTIVKLAVVIQSYQTTFDKIIHFQQAYSKQILAYNEFKHGKKGFLICNILEIAKLETGLFEFIRNYDYQQEELDRLENKVFGLKESYPNGFHIAEKKGLIPIKATTSNQLKQIIESENIISIQEDIHNASLLLNANPDGIRKVFVKTPSYPISEYDARQILINKDVIQNWQKRIENERREIEKKLSRERELEYIIQNETKLLQERVTDWYTHHFNGSIKHKWFCDYYSYDAHQHIASQEMRDTWHFIWNFKNDPERNISTSEHDTALKRAVNLVETTLKDTFGYLLSKLTLVCCTASTNEKNERRFRPFAEIICRDLNMYNAYNHITIIEDSYARHEGGTGLTQKQYDRNWFKDKYIILFDDVRTSGRSLIKEKSILESFGAKVICAITLGQTRHM